MEFIKNNPKATQKEIATHIRKSERTVKTITTKYNETEGVIMQSVFE